MSFPALPLWGHTAFNRWQFSSALRLPLGLSDEFSPPGQTLLSAAPPLLPSASHGDHRQSEVPTLATNVKNTISACVVSRSKASHTLTGHCRFSTPMFQSRCLPASTLHRQIIPVGHDQVFLPRERGLAPLFTCLSYPATLRLRRCQVFQLSPPTSAPFLTPQQPTRAVSVTPFLFRTSQSLDLHQFIQWQGWSWLPKLPFPCRPTPLLACKRIGSKKNCRSSAPVATAPTPIKRYAATAVLAHLAGEPMSFDAV